MARVGAFVGVCAVSLAAIVDRRSKRARPGQTLCDGLDATSSAAVNNAATTKWAYPSPYDEGVAPGRFADTSTLHTASKRVWDLPKLVNIWRNTDEEAWPWVWCDRNPLGPQHVFINVHATTLAQVES